MAAPLRAPFPYFGGKSRVAEVVWRAFGDVPNYVEPFFGSGAVLLARPHAPKIETVNDIDCVAPETRLLRADMSWAPAGDILVGDRLLAFDEQNGPTTGPGLRAPSRYRRFAHATVTGVRRIVKPCYRLTFDDGTTVVSSADHQWLGGSHKSGGKGGGRGWRWLKTSSLVCNRETQRSWVLKVCDVVEREDSFDAGWLSGLYDGEGSVTMGPGLKVVVSQNPGPVLDRAQALLEARGIAITRGAGARRCQQLTATGGKHEQLALLMRLRPARLIRNFVEQCQEVSLYGREHRAVGLVSKEFLGDREVMAIETDARTYIAEGLASHNCFLACFWRAVTLAPDEVASWCDSPVNEADLHARHRWLVDHALTSDFRHRMRHEPEFFDAKVAGWWVWGLSMWIGSGWCDGELARKRPGARGNRRGVRSAAPERGPRRKQPNVGSVGRGVHAISEQIPSLNGGGRGDSAPSRPPCEEWFAELSARLRRVRVCCGDWTRVLGDSVIGTTRTRASGMNPCGVFLDPPYGDEGREGGLYASDDMGVAAEVARWARERGGDPDLRIALCGYEGEHEMPGWTCHAWKALRGYAGEGNDNAGRERVWFSPHCLPLEPKQPSLFGGA